MFPDYESLEDSFPQLRGEREIQEELRKAKQAHAYLVKISKGEATDSRVLREYMRSEENGFDVVDSDDEATQRPSKPVKVDIKRRNNRRSSATMADLPQEDLFGFAVPPKPKSFPSGGRRLGTRQWSLWGELKGLLAGTLLTDEEVLFCVCVSVFLLWFVRRMLTKRSSHTAQIEKINVREAQLSALQSRLENLLSRTEHLLAGRATSAPQYIILPSNATGTPFPQPPSQSSDNGSAD